MKEMSKNAAISIQRRKADFPIEQLLLARWSPRAMNDTSLSDEEVHTLFEAARWAPSTYNEQEWRFIYARRESAQWDLLFDLLVEGNQAWCQRAGLLSVILAHKVFSRNGKPNPVHLFDCGCAFQNLALQGSAMGLVVHGMQGFDYEKARATLNVPDEYAVVAMFAAGHPGEEELLSQPLRDIEHPSGRREIKEFIAEGVFAF